MFFACNRSHTIPFFVSANVLPLNMLSYVLLCTTYLPILRLTISVIFLLVHLKFIRITLDFLMLVIFELFFVKKNNLLVGARMLWTGQWVSESVRDVCMSHQSDWIYYKQPIKFLVVKVNGI